MNGEEYYERFDPTQFPGVTGPDDDPDNCKKCARCLSQFRNTGFANLPVTMSFMVLCQICGNKRCPKATFHGFDCSGSNEPGQDGSRYA